jgi:PAS domain S-box-containing protein
MSNPQGTPAKLSQPIAPASHGIRAREPDILSVLFFDSPQPMWVYDRNTRRFLEVNEAAVGRYGYSHDEFLAMRIDRLEAPPGISPRLRDVYSQGASCSGRRTYMHRDGNLIDVEIRSHPITFCEKEAELVVGHEVVDRDRVEQALRESEERYSDLLHGVKDYAIFMLSPGGYVVNWNQGAERIKGYKASEIIGSHLSCFYTPEDVRGAVPWRALLVAAEQGRHEETGWRVRKDGSRFWADAVVTAVRDHQGELRGFCKITRDITERKEADEALRLAEQKYRHIFEEAILGIFQSTPEGRLLSVNPAMARMCGYESPGLMIASVVDIRSQFYADPSRRDEIERLLQQHKLVEHFEIQVHRKDGAKIWLSVNARAVRIGGRITHYEGTLEEITDRKLLQEQLVEAEQKYRSIVDNANFGVFQSTPDGRYLTVNPALATMLGYSSIEDLYASLTSIPDQLYVDPERRQEFKRLLEEHGAVQHFELQAYRKDRSKMWIAANVRAVRQNGVITHYEGINEDITQYKLLQDQFRQAQKMEAVGRLAGGIAHDFNNSLAVITGYSDLLQLHLSPGDPLRAYAEEVGKAGRRAASLTRQLLGFSRKQVIHPVVLDLNTVIGEMEQMIRRLIGDDIQVAFKREPQLGRVKFDPGQLEQILMNLAVNARDAMPTGGKLWLETSNVEVDNAYALQNPYAKPGRYVMLSVSDSGCGIDSETQRHIFEPFFTTKSPGKGTGLGLSTVYGIVKQNGGTVNVYSEVGKGSTFRIKFPLTQEGSEESEPAQPAKERLTGSESILLVEDEEALRALAHTCLVSRGYRVLEAESPAEARRVIAERPTHIDLLLTDVIMPGASGPELAKLLREINPQLKVLFMSGYSGDLLAQHGVLEPGILLLEKPFSMDSLLATVREAIGVPENGRSASAG